MTRFFTYFLCNGSQHYVFRPLFPIVTRLKIQLSNIRIFCEKIKKAPFCFFGLWVGHFFSTDFFKTVYAVRFYAFVFKTHAASSPSTDKYPDVSLIVNGNRRIVVGVVNPHFVTHNQGLRNLPRWVVICSNDAEQVFTIF